MSEQETFNIGNYLDILRRRRNIAILFFFLTVVVVTAVTFLVVPVYRATGTLLIDIESPNVLVAGEGVAIGTQGYASYNSYREYYKSQMSIIVSEPILQQVFNEFELIKLKEYAKTKEPLKKFAKTVNVGSVRETRLLKLNIDNKNPELSAKIANRIADIYIQHNLAYISKGEWLNLLKNEYLRLKSRVSEYSKIYKVRHPVMIRLQEEMAEVIENITRGKKSSFTERDIEGAKAKSQYQSALEGLKANNVSIVSVAQIPIVPVKPNKIFNICMAIAVGLFGGVGLAFLAEYQDFSVKSAEDLESLVDWPFLGQIPKIAGVRKEFHAQKHSGDFVTESFRAIRTQLLFLNTKENPVKAIVITSLGPQEGKTIILCNLGIVLAQNNMKVLLVDADMRKPRLHIIFKKKGTKGLSNFLAGQAEYKDIIQETEIKNLFLVDNNQSPSNPAELLSSERMRNFVNLVKEDFDFILFDSPPIGMITDATILARMLDGVAVVVEAEKTPKKAVLRSDKLFKNSRVKILGVIINKAAISGSESYYSSYADNSSKR